MGFLTFFSAASFASATSSSACDTRSFACKVQRHTVRERQRLLLTRGADASDLPAY